MGTACEACKGKMLTVFVKKGTSERTVDGIRAFLQTEGQTHTIHVEKNPKDLPDGEKKGMGSLRIEFLEKHPAVDSYLAY